MTPLRNHPGWRKGVRIQLVSGTVVKVLADGRYLPFCTDDWEGYAWHYRVRFPDGAVQERVPHVGDKPVNT